MVMVGNGERGELREKESKRKRKIRMGKCWLVRDTSEYASPFVTGKLFCLTAAAGGFAQRCTQDRLRLWVICLLFILVLKS